MASRKAANVNLHVSNPAEEQMAKFVRGTTPWLVWLVGIPVIAATFRILADTDHQGTWIAAGLAVGTVVVTWVTWRVSHAKNHGKIHHALNAATGMGVITATAAWGPGAGGGALVVFYTVGGLIACITWNVRYTVHTDGGPEDVMTKPKRPDGQKHVDLSYVIRAASGHAPVIRAVAERTGKVVPAMVGPWREPPRVAGVPAMAAITAGPAAAALPAVSADDLATAVKRGGSIVRNFRDLAAHKVPDLGGAKIKVLDAKPWRIRTEVILVRGVQTPKVVIDVRELIASQNALPLTAIVATPSRKRHDRVFLDFVLENVLRQPIEWPGPSAPGQSIASAPVRIGLYEDRRVAERFGPAITAAMAKQLHRGEKNLSHLIMEGMNGSGKSTLQRIQIADAATRIDVEEWLIDTVKKLQTFGPLASAFEWFATTPAEAKALARFLADVVIPARAHYLGARGYDNWERGCGIPYLRVTVEEGGIIANELDKLDAVLNSARSTGVEIDLSAQRVHHALVDTNVRAAFSETASFGCKSIEDVFAMPDDLRDAGADPSQWSNKQPGMNYWASAELDLDAQLMPVRGFTADADALGQIVDDHVDARAAWIAEHCPDWAALLEQWDRQGIYAKRTTGRQVATEMRTAKGRRAGGAPLKVVTAQVLDEPAEPEPETEAEMDPTEDPFAEPEDRPVTMDELNLDAENRQAVDEDAGIDPAAPIQDEPGPELQFPGRPQGTLSKEQALGMLRSWLLDKGAGFEFAPRDLYDDPIFARLGKSAGWLRTVLAGDLVSEGLLEHDRGDGIYRVRAVQMRASA